MKSIATAILAALSLAFALTGCASADKNAPPPTPQAWAEARATEIETGYILLKSGAVFCTAEIICTKDQAKVAETVLASADNVIPVLVARIRARGTDASQLTLLLDDAQAALTTLAAELNRLGVKASPGPGAG